MKWRALFCPSKGADPSKSNLYFCHLLTGGEKGEVQEKTMNIQQEEKIIKKKNKKKRRKNQGYQIPISPLLIQLLGMIATQQS